MLHHSPLPASQSAAVNQPATRCLMVEDNSFDQKKIKRVLARSSLAVEMETATTLAEARQILARGGVDMILLDNNLPDGLGADFALELARDEQTAAIPIVMVSDWPSPFMWDKANMAGVLHVVNKTDFGARYVNAALRVVGRNMRRAS
jgi:CheY-like chemotaxis protein